MKTCWICKNWLEPGECLEHPKCGREWGRRYDSRECLRCGTPGISSRNVECEACVSANAPYRGYPGDV